MSDLERYEAAAAFLRDNLARLIGASPPAGYSVSWRPDIQRRAAEERDRRDWLDGVKRRLGLVCAGELPYRIEWLLEFEVEGRYPE